VIVAPLVTLPSAAFADPAAFIGPLNTVSVVASTVPGSGDVNPYLLGAGVHPKVVSERLGHAGEGITLDTYSHVLPTMQREAANVLELRLLGNA
jgi:hypothetical protein